jgi:hypothetical protein
MNLMDASLTEGRHTFEWQFKGKEGKEIKSGTYLCILRSGNYSNKIKFIVQ